MKKIFTLAAGLLVALTMFAQVPKAINYQAVARNSSGQALVSQTIKVRIGLSESSGTGTATFYSETRTVTTNTLGLFNIQIGSAGASNVYGNFTGTDWLSPNMSHVITVELDINNNNNFVNMGSQDLVTVPYAFAADNAANTKGLQGRPVSATTPANGDVLTWSGSSWTPGASSSFAGIQTYSVGGPIGLINSNNTNPSWVFAAAPVVVTISGSQKNVTASISGSFGSNTGSLTPRTVGVVMCYQPVAGGSITPFNPTNFSEYSIGLGTPVNASGTIKLNPGQYNVGLGVRNNTSTTLNMNDYLNGYIMVY
ncbi:MAG: hypothetical protein JSR97_13300 [Verrucomicrobia bacterium]|nr:hypothetical protein [Verrucomicrobiota bacterium]